MTGSAQKSTITLVPTRLRTIITRNGLAQRKSGKWRSLCFQKEVSAYLKSDVEVLVGSLAAFSEEMVELTGIDPVTECVTIASTAFKVWQKMFLEPNLIALAPRNGWRRNQQNQNVEALQWLEFENFKIGGGIQVS